MLGSLDEAAELIAASRQESLEQQQIGNAAQEEGAADDKNETRKIHIEEGIIKRGKGGPYKKKTKHENENDDFETKKIAKNTGTKEKKTLEKTRERRKRKIASIDLKLERMQKRKLVEPKKVMTAYKAFSDNNTKAKLCRSENSHLTNAEKYAKLRELWNTASEEEKAEAETHVNKDKLRYQREMQTFSYKKTFMEIAAALLRGELVTTETPKPRKPYFLFECSERANSDTIKHSKDLSKYWKSMTQDEQKSFNDDYEIQQQLYKSLQPIFQEKMKFLSEEEKDALEEKGKGVKEVNQRVGIETEETKTELNERANAELHARFERARGLEFLRDVKYLLPPLGYVGSDEKKKQKVNGRKFKDTMEKETGIINLDRMKIVPKTRSEFGYDILKKKIDNLSEVPAIQTLSSKCHLDASSLAKILGSQGSVVDFDKFKAFVEKGGNDVELVAAFRKYVMYNPPDWASFKKELKL